MKLVFVAVLVAIFAVSCTPYQRSTADVECRQYAYAMYAADDANVRYVECIRLHEQDMETR